MSKINFIIGTVPHNLFSGFETEGIGEERWGLNIAKTLVESGYNVYTLPNKGQWLSNNPKPVNYYSCELPSPNQENYYLGYYFPQYKILNGCKKYLLCRFDSFIKTETFSSEYIIVHPYPNNKRLSNLKSKVQGTTCYFLPHIIPIENNIINTFDNKNLLWTTKGGFDCQSINGNVVFNIVKYLAELLKQNPELTLSFLTASHGKNNEQAIAAIKNHRCYSLLKPFENRVILYPSVSYSKVKNLIRNSKLIINPGKFHHTYGGSVLEAAAYGIPTINQLDNPFDKNIVLTYKNNVDYISTLQQLFYDKDFYIKNSIAYRDNVSRIYSKENFLKQLFAILDIKEF